MKKRLIFILLLGATLAACKKEPLPVLPAETGPYYSINGFIDGIHTNLNVGQEGILISQGKTTISGIEHYYGQIVSPSEDLLIKIDFVRPEAPMSTTGLAALSPGSINYLIHQPGCLSPSFGANLAQPNYLLIKNEFGVFESIDEVEFDEYGIHNVTMKFTDVSQNSFQVPVNYGFNELFLNAGFQAFGSMDTVYLSAFNTGLSHEWYVDGSFMSSETIYATVLSNGIHKVEHKLIDDNGNEASNVTLVRVTDFVLDWQMSMSNCQGGSTPISSYGNVTVTIITGGQEYKSSNSVDNFANSFIVSDVEYVGNSGGDPVRAVFDFNFDAILVNDTNTDSLSLSGMSGTFNVGLQ